METIRRSVVIDAPVSRVFEQLTPPANLLPIWPSMVAIENAVTRHDGGHAFDWTYRMVGLRFRGHADTVEVERDRLRVDRNEGGIPSTFRWRFAAKGRATEVTLDVEYELPFAAFGRLAAPFVRLANEREAGTLLANLKAQLERPHARNREGVTPAR